MTEAEEELQDEALGWVIRLRGEDASTLSPDFEEWVARSPAHRRAFDWAQAHFDDSEVLKDSEQFGVSRWRTRRRWIYAAAALAAALLVAYGLQSAPVGPFGASQAYAEGVRYATGHGDIRSFALADGSQITLDSDSRAVVAMSGGERRIRVDAGRLRIALGQGVPPIVVDAGAGAIRAEAGTVDIAYAAPGAVDVSLVEGRAELNAAAQTSLEVATTIRYAAVDGGGAQAVRPGADRRAWPSGWVSYHAIRLDALVADANRYARSSIHLDDPATAALSVSGRFNLTNTEAFVRGIAEVFDLRVTHRADGIHLASRKK